MRTLPFMIKFRNFIVSTRPYPAHARITASACGCRFFLGNYSCCDLGCRAPASASAVGRGTCAGSTAMRGVSATGSACAGGAHGCGCGCAGGANQAGQDCARARDCDCAAGPGPEAASVTSAPVPASPVERGPAALALELRAAAAQMAALKRDLDDRRPPCCQRGTLGEPSPQHVGCRQSAEQRPVHQRRRAAALGAEWKSRRRASAPGSVAAGARG
jgi:hypothetical protein